MAEFGVKDNNRELPRPRPPHPSSTGGGGGEEDTPVAGDEGAGETVLNGDCRGIAANMVGVGSGSVAAVAVPAATTTSTGTGSSQAGLEAAANNTSDAMDGKSGIPRRSSIIKVGRCIGVVLLTVLCWI